MMRQKIESLFKPMTIKDFNDRYFRTEPYASRATALHWKDFLTWPLIQEILNSNHDDCWLPRLGRMPEDVKLNTGRLTPKESLQGFSEGRTLLIRHSERAHSQIRAIADGFEKIYERPIDVQLYCTPPDQEGFGWHFDIEDVFVIQSSGEKEFFLRKELDHGEEVRCHLKGGDWLYIPAGYWHKARAKNFSVHFSIGVLYDEKFKLRSRFHEVI